MQYRNPSKDSPRTLHGFAQASDDGFGLQFAGAVADTRGMTAPHEHGPTADLFDAAPPGRFGLHDPGPGGTVWHQLLFCVAVVIWTPLSLMGWLAAAIGMFGWDAGRDLGRHSLVTSPTGEAAFAVVMAAALFAVGTLVLVGLGRWALPDRRRLGTSLAFVGVVWAPAVATGVALT
jgi:hypothetical protein